MATSPVDEDEKSSPAPEVAGVDKRFPKNSQTENLDPKIQSAIGQALQTYYDGLVNEPLPDRLLVLLAELEAKERRDGS